MTVCCNNDSVLMKKFFRALSQVGAQAKNVATTSSKKLYQILIIVDFHPKSLAYVPYSEACLLLISLLFQYENGYASAFSFLPRMK